MKPSIHKYIKHIHPAAAHQANTPQADILQALAQQVDTLQALVLQVDTPQVDTPRALAHQADTLQALVLQSVKTSHKAETHSANTSSTEGVPLRLFM